MTNSPFQEAVAIDTNVFEHLLNPQNNTSGHIDILLQHLRQQSVALLVDDSGRISQEYNHRIGPMIQHTHDERGEKYTLRYWMRFAHRSQTTVDRSDKLMATIRSIISEPSTAVDRILVYVALSQGKILISNDKLHIICGPIGQRPQHQRRRRLLRKSRKGADIITSQEACARI